MEAVPKLPLISYELKSSPENPHFGSKLKQYISEAYREDPDSYNNEIHQLEGLRSSAVRPSIDATGLSTMYRYFCQLKALQSRFPMSKGQPVACTFGWRDLYSNSTTYVADLRFEMGCILYNIGALHTQLASSEPRNTADSLKASCTHYQNAAWAFQCLREQYPQQGGVDVSVEIVRLMQEICFAQAQECILDKSIQDTRKPSVVGAVASQVQLFYKNSLALLGSSTGTDNIHEVIGTKIYNYWHRYLSFKLSYIGCIVCLYQGMHSEEQRKMGERVAFYQLAVDKLGEARKLAKYIEPKRITEEALTFTNDVVEGKRKAAKNENEFIYHEEVPEKDMLVDFKPVCLVKALALNLNDPEVSGPDIFARLVPIGAHEASSLYSEEKAKLLRNIVGQAEAKNMELTEFMSSLQLDQLEVLDAEERIPQEIVDRCAAMNAKTEIIQTLVDSMNNLAEIISDVEQSLADIKVLIQEETLKEKEYQKTMGPRPPSIVQTELSREYHKYQEAHARTNESNQVLHKAMTLHIANLRLLAQPLDVLQAKIPSIDNIEGLDRETMAEMRRVVSKVREMQAQRDSLIQQLREAVTADDITSKLLARSEDNADEIFKEEIEKHTPKVKIIEQNLAAQENIINRLTSLYAAYGDSRRMLADVLRKREGLINALITSYDTHEELLGKSHKGLEFYNKLSHNVRNLLTRARATCQVQAEERATLLAAQAARAATPTSSSTPSPALPAGLPPPAAGMKLKDYLPYMKNRGRAAPIAPVEPVPADGYYPESIYPTSVRPAPVGSEANDATQMAIPDGVVLPTSSHNPSMPFNRFASPFVSNDSESYASYYEGQKTNYAKPVEDNPYAYNTPFTPSQFPNQMSDHQIYQNPYYSGTQSNITQVTESPNPYNSNPYAHEPQIPPANQINTIPEAMPYPTNQVDLNSSFAQLQVGGPKTENPYAQDYSQTYYNVQYPNASTPNTSTYSHAGQHNQNGQNMNMTSSQNMAEYSSLNYPYSTESTVPVSNTFNAADPQYSYPNTYNTNQGYPIYTNTETTGAMTSSISSTATSVDPFSADPHYIDPAIRAQLEAIDKPIKSHVTGEALAANVSYPSNLQAFEATPVANFSNPEPAQPTSSYLYNEQPNTSMGYTQQYQNHPGYTFNPALGNYEYSYGSQNSYSNYSTMDQGASAQSFDSAQPSNKEWSQQVYTSAGTCDTVQSPSECPVQPLPQTSTQSNDQIYYNLPYGYQTMQPNEVPPSSVPAPSNYGSYMNQSTYIQSNQDQNTSVTFASNQVSTPIENVQQPNSDQTDTTNVQNVPVSENTAEVPQETVENPPEVKPVTTEVAESKPEPTVFDLLSDIDFAVEIKPLTPEIKVPQISETAIKKPVMETKSQIVKIPKEEVIERPAKMDIFSDPSLMNKFTQEVKDLQNYVESFTNKTTSGLTVLDAKWKTLQDVQTKENMNRSKAVSRDYEGNMASHVVPYDDSRVTLKSDPDAYINASLYKQLAPWCIPLVLSKNPPENTHSIFWRAILENKISCVVCLLTEIEMQGKPYWPTAKGQSLELNNVRVTLEEVTCTVHWTERKISVASGNTVHSVTHYQINVFPAKIVCSPLVMLCDKILSQTYENRVSNQLQGAWVQCAAGSGRSSVVSLLLMTMCQVRAGQIELRSMLDTGCINLCRNRTNVLEDTKYLADAHITALFYVQGVLCSGTTMFNGDAVTVQTGAAVLPPPPPAQTVSANQRPPKFSRESFEEMKQSPGLKSGDMKDPLNFLDPLWSLKKK